VPLILLYRTVTRNRLSPVRARVGMTALLVGYVAVWAAAGLPVYAYALNAETMAASGGILAAISHVRMLACGSLRARC
jgi:predicted metal-binding membrane protein